MEYSDSDKRLTVEKNDKEIKFEQKERGKENKHTSVTGRPDINKISKRNEEAIIQERKSSYSVAGIIVILIIVVMFLVYFFS